MFEIDKSKFGEFVAALRKEKNLTQKELAARLFVSDKAVSKWETGQSIPDVSLLIPLAECLGVTATELLECRRLEKAAKMKPEEVEKLLQKTISLSAEKEKRRGPTVKTVMIYLACAAAAVGEVAALSALGQKAEDLWAYLFVYVALGLGFGSYFFFLVRERLPAYYDSNRINGFVDGPFRLNMPGIRFNNSNWPHVVRAGRFGTMAMAVSAPALYAAVYYGFPKLWASGMFPYFMTFVVLALLFVPLYRAAKKYE